MLRAIFSTIVLWALLVGGPVLAQRTTPCSDNCLGITFGTTTAAAPTNPLTDLGNKNQFANSQTLVTNVLLHSVPAAQPVICGVYDGNASITGATVTDTKSNTYALTKAAGTGGGGSPFAQIFTSFITTPLTTSDTITYTANSGFTSQTMDISCFTALTGYTTGVDTATTNSNPQFTASWTVTGLGSAAVANELYIGFVIAFNNPTATGPWNTNPPSSPNTIFLASEQINPVTATLTYSGTQPTSQWATPIIMSLKP